MEDFAIKVENLSKVFKLPHEKTSSIKSAFINFYRREKGYELQRALNNVSFEIGRGEFFGIVGRNGSGKSTLLKLLAGIYAPTNGQVHVRGSLTPFIELGVGFNPELTGRENVYLNGALLGFSRKEMQAMYKDIVEFAELERFMDQKLKNYSSGMQVRLAFSIAIRAKSDILLLDEVLAVGDAAFQQKCYSYFENLKQEKKTVVFVSHDMGAIRRFCTKAIYIKGGKITYHGLPSEIADMYILDNLEGESSLSSGPSQKVKSKYKIGAKISEQSDDSAVLDVDYEAEKTDDVYVAFSVLKEGMSVAELSTPMDMKLSGRGRVTYTLDKNLFNAGIYEVTLVLCRKKARELLVICKDKPRFAVKGSDITKGGALKLDHNWQLAKKTKS